jgi:hypothetical protein
MSPIAPSGWNIPVFAAAEPEEMLIDEVEALWAPIAAADDWAPLHAKLRRLEAARVAYASPSAEPGDQAKGFAGSP